MSKIISPERLPDHGIKLSNRQRQRLEALGQFPKRNVLTSRTHGYVADEIDAFLDGKIAARSAPRHGEAA
jgi:predicted DNA-binding transcriptional regulator AlpA